MSPFPCFSFCRYEGFLSACHDVLILLDDALDVLNMSFDVIFAHRINFQQHGIVQPLDHFLIGKDLIVQLFQLCNLCSIGTLCVPSRSSGCGSKDSPWSQRPQHQRRGRFR